MEAPALDVQFTALLRVLGGAVIGAVLGWERERQERPAGLRTYMAVGMAAALIMALADFIMIRYPAVEELNADPTRVLEAVVGGVSFLGAGTIVIHRDPKHVGGLTTAAGLLVTATLGVAIGMGAYVLSIAGTVMMLLVLVLSRAFDAPPSGAHEEPGSDASASA